MARGLAAVYLSEPSETAFDLRFWLFGTHVRVHPLFWLVSAVLGWGVTGQDPGPTGLMYLGLWVFCVFVSVLIHEFGHIFMGRLFGAHGHIVLISFGGLAVGSNALERGWQRFLVAFAGPLIQFVVFGVTLVGAIFLLPRMPAAWHPTASRVVEFLLEINLFWPILNLLPVWPLDGGQMAREVFVAAAPRNGLFLSLALSALVAGALAVHCIMVRYNPAWPFTAYLPFGGIYMTLFFAMFCVQSIMAAQAIRPVRRQDHDDEFPWER
jgi:stage IV sporulation protein FB